MKNLYLMLLLLGGGIIILSTCKKDSTPAICKVVQTKAVSANGTDTVYINYSYSSDGRLSKVDMGGGYYTNYSYSGSTLTSTVYSKNVIYETNTYTLNSSGYADIAINKDSSNKVASNTVYTYDENGYLTAKTITKTADITDVTTTTYSYDDNGNMILNYTEHNIGSSDYTANWQNDKEYYADKPDNNSSTKGYEGKKNKNLAKTNTYSFNGAIALTTNYAYELNADGYMTKQTTVSGGSIIYTFPVYNCK